MITVSVVSHGHGAMVMRLLSDLARCPGVETIILTLNIAERFDELPDNVVVIRNPSPKGFGANHNAAFAHCRSSHFCVLNPDVRLPADPFPVLVESLERNRAALVAPLVVTSEGSREDSLRHFPSPASLALKAFGMGDGSYNVQASSAEFAPDWIAGMFMLFDTRDFAELGGFDEAFFLYYEDVDLCARVWASGRRIVACPGVSVIHDAQRASRRVWRYRRMHFVSMLRYFARRPVRLVPPLMARAH